METNNISELTREDIMEMEKDPSEKGRINWEAWDRIVQNYRDKHKDDDYSDVITNKFKMRYVYDDQGRLLFQGSSFDMVEFVKPWLTLSNAGVVTACSTERYRNGLFFTNHNYTQAELLRLKDKINFKRKKSLFWKTRIRLTKTAVVMLSVNEEELMRFKDVNEAWIWVRENISKKALKGNISKSLNDSGVAYGHKWKYLIDLENVTSGEELLHEEK